MFDNPYAVSRPAFRIDVRLKIGTLLSVGPNSFVPKQGSFRASNFAHFDRATDGATTVKYSQSTSGQRRQDYCGTEPLVTFAAFSTFQRNLFIQSHAVTRVVHAWDDKNLDVAKTIDEITECLCVFMVTLIYSC